MYGLTVSVSCNRCPGGFIHTQEFFFYFYFFLKQTLKMKQMCFSHVVSFCLRDGYKPTRAIAL